MANKQFYQKDRAVSVVFTGSDEVSECGWLCSAEQEAWRKALMDLGTVFLFAALRNNRMLLLNVSGPAGMLN